MSELTREQILNIDDLPLEKVDVPEWGGSVYMRTLTGKQRDEFEQLAFDRQKQKNLDIRGCKVKLVAMCLCDKDGKLLFGGRDDESKLIEKSGAALQRLSEIAQRLSGMNEKEIEDIAADFEEGPNANSGSD